LVLLIIYIVKFIKNERVLKWCFCIEQFISMPQLNDFENIRPLEFSLGLESSLGVSQIQLMNIKNSNKKYMMATMVRSFGY